MAIRLFSQKARDAIGRAPEFSAEYLDILAQLEALRKQSMDGIPQEKVHVKHDEPITVIERYPTVALQCIMGKFQVLNKLHSLAEDTDEAPDWLLEVKVLPLESH